MCSLQGVEMFEKIRQIRRCGFVGSGVALLEQRCIIVSGL